MFSRACRTRYGRAWDYYTWTFKDISIFMTLRTFTRALLEFTPHIYHINVTTRVFCAAFGLLTFLQNGCSSSVLLRARTPRWPLDYRLKDDFGVPNEIHHLSWWVPWRGSDWRCAKVAIEFLDSLKVTSTIPWTASNPIFPTQSVFHQQIRGNTMIRYKVQNQSQFTTIITIYYKISTLLTTSNEASSSLLF